MSQKLAVVLSLALSAAAVAHNPNKQKRAPSPTLELVERGPPYPTGSGYDVVPLASIVPLSPGELHLTSTRFQAYPTSPEYSANPVPVPSTYPAGSKPPITNAPPIPSCKSLFVRPPKHTTPAPAPPLASAKALAPPPSCTIHVVVLVEAHSFPAKKLRCRLAKRQAAASAAPFISLPLLCLLPPRLPSLT